jgi:hypothetical protein
MRQGLCQLARPPSEQFCSDRGLAPCAGDNFYGGSKISRRAAHLRETDCVAGVGGLELRNVVANYPFERSHRFAGIQPNSGHRNYSRLSCAIRLLALEDAADIDAGSLIHFK